MDRKRVELYQDRAVAEIAPLLAQGSDAALSAPVGAGKTEITIRLVREEVARGGRVLVLQDRATLAEQSAAKARARGLSPTLAVGGAVDGGGEVVYGVVNTVASDPAAVGRRTLLVVDETHHATDREGSLFKGTIDALVALNPDMKVLTTSATMERSDGRRLHPRVEAARRVTITWGETIAAGMLLPVTTIQGTTRLSDGSTLQDRARAMIDPADPARSAIGLNAVARRLRPDDLVEQVAQSLLRDRRVPSGPTLAFLDTVRDAEALAERLREAGRPFEAIHSRMAPDEVRRRVTAYHEGRIQGLASVDMIGEGFDAPRTQVLLNAKVTMSPVEHVQFLGRGSRWSEGKRGCVCLDVGAATMMHGRLEVLAAVQDYLLGRRDGTPTPDGRRWSPWTACGPNVVGMDLGGRSLYARKVGDAVLVMATEPCADGTTRVCRVGAMDAAGARALGRREVAAARKTVVTLLSDVREDGTTAMEARLRAGWQRHGTAMGYIVDAEREARRGRARAAQGPGR